MTKRTDAEMNEGQGTKEPAEMAANNTGVDTTETPQADELRAYAPAGAAMAFAEPEEEDAAYGEDEDYFDPDDEELQDESSEAEADSVSAADHMRDFAEQDFIDETVNTINSMYRKNVDNGKLEIGAYLLTEVYKGDIEEAMSTNPQKHKTFSKILERTDLLVEPKTLGSWVRAAAVLKDLHKRSIKLPSLTTYHYVELATVRDDTARIKFAKKAELEQLTVKGLREAIRKENGRRKSDAEQLKSEMDRSLRQFSDLDLNGDLTDFASDVESVKEAYPPEKAMKLLPEVKKCLTNVRASENWLKEFHGSLRTIVKEAMEPLSD